MIEEHTIRFDNNNKFVIILITVENIHVRHWYIHSTLSIEYWTHTLPLSLSIRLRFQNTILFVVIKYSGNRKLNSESRTNNVIEFHLNFPFRCKNVLNLFSAIIPSPIEKLFSINFFPSSCFTCYVIIFCEMNQLQHFL